jgi:ADP-dependent NAD(P)H-hydrate dehydratase
VSPPVEVTPAVLAALAPAPPEDAASKFDRGTVLVVGGSPETPGAVLLSGIAALRAGAGRLQLAVDGPIDALAVAVPEARVMSLGEGVEGVVACAEGSTSLLVGPGMLDRDRIEPVLDALTSAMPTSVLVVDAGALAVAGAHPDWVRRMGRRVVLLPNPGEFEELGLPDARAAAEHFDAVVAVRGPETIVATPTGDHYVDRHGCAGLATSGSGDVASGIALGLVARGATPLGAAVWAAALHGRAGELLGDVGFLARELLDVLPEAASDLGLPA